MYGFRFSPSSGLFPLSLSPLPTPLDLYCISLPQGSLFCLKIPVQHFRCPIYDYKFTKIRTPQVSERLRVFPDK